MRKLLVPMFMAVVVARARRLGGRGPAGPGARGSREAADEADRPPAARSSARRTASAAPRSGGRKRKARPAFAVPPHLQAIAQCESGGDPRAIGGGGAYRGKYQFSYSTWAGVGGTGDPAAAPEAEQDRRAAMLYERSGPGQWPVCGS